MAFEVYKLGSSNNRAFSALTSKLKQRLEVLKKLAFEDFKKSVWINLYTKYKPTVYDRTYSLLNCITVSDIKQEGAILSFEIYFDTKKLTHYSVVSGDNTYNGKNIYTPPLLDEGHKQSGYSGQDMFHNYPARDFIDEAIIFIKSDLQKTLKYIIKSEVKKIGGKNKY